MSNKKSIVPELRFPEFEGDWEEKELHDACDMKAGKFVKASEINEIQERNTFPCFGGNGLRGFTTTFTHSGRYPLIGRQGAHCGNVTLAEDCFHATEHAVVASPKEKIEVTWLYYALVYLRLNQYATGQAQPGLSVSNLEKVPLQIPKTEKEQQKIAGCLSSLDALITAHRDKLNALRAHKKGLMQNLFPQEGERVPRYRFEGFVGAWEEKELNDACDMKAGKFVKASEINEIQKKNTFPCFGGNGLRGFTTTFTHSGRYPLIGRQGAHCGNITLAGGSFHATEHAVVALPKEKIDVTWLYYALVYLRLNQYATGQAQPGLSVSNLEKVSLQIPKTEKEQQKIANCLSSVDELIAAQSDRIAQLREHKRGLMQGLFPKID